MDPTKEYLKLWDDFTQSLVKYRDCISEGIANGEVDNIHFHLKEMSGIPYEKLHTLADNIGAATGLFFEHNVQTFFVNAVKNKLPTEDLIVSYNSCNRHKEKGLPRDPDILLQLGENEVVIELKAAPKKRDFEYIKSLHLRYSKNHVPYYVIGNYMSVNTKDASELSQLGWISMLNSSASNQGALSGFPTCDDLVDRVVCDLTQN
ncbi:hypothetical protein TUMSATVNIG1_25000 [Vibrio nigripulchritudo]|uniref:hypothetical protein n=1 Tax=Vibrio nigripulchritudo TaxID=28173 RepID=UPI00190DFA5D|nr:hypothetical protein [Vibrio nigripulchritudo]BCL70538.1 hypothetical protein VNTUMSATTG_24750 [Vibrio nigripulchritudo]BDU31891.1 hypothetical protein TUMSATVNIG1_25000 [Vibrio nigripulchritudo]